jgi:predicted NAD-dependent protein-ADP-ribosyltransferase YbiA (DUF1768 family)
MLAGLELKFGCNADIRKALLATHPQELVEGNYWHDNYWGNCLCPKCTHIEGQNHLGKLLMKIRENYLLAEMPVEHKLII